MYFEIPDKALTHLAKKDKKFAHILTIVPKPQRKIETNLFRATLHAITGQQISTKAHVTVWKRVQEKYPNLEPQDFINAPVEDIKSLGMSYRKVDYIQSLAFHVQNNTEEFESLHSESEENIIKKLSSLRGIGVWTAEMLMIFSMQRQNILSYYDLGIIRGLCQLYGHKEISKEQFARYHKRYSPYASTASLYLWEIAGGALAD